jgi:hypothetical protein
MSEQIITVVGEVTSVFLETSDEWQESWGDGEVGRWGEKRLTISH